MSTDIVTIFPGAASPRVLSECQTDIIDRSSWDDGPWTGEPDRITWTHSDYPGLMMVAKRVSHGAWCGYVLIPPEWGIEDHVDYRHTPDQDPDDLWPVVHGSVTGYLDVPGAYAPGFDCSHKETDDLTPGNVPFSATLAIASMFNEGFQVGGGSTYRDLPFVVDQCESMAAQVLAKALELGTTS